MVFIRECHNVPIGFLIFKQYEKQPLITQITVEKVILVVDEL